MSHTLATCCLGLLLTCHPVLAAEPVKLTVQLRGVVSDADAEVLQQRLQRLDGISIDVRQIERGERGPFRHYFSPPFEVELSDPDQLDIGALAEVIAEAQTPSRDEIAPSLNLMVFDRRAVVDEDDIGAIREAVRGVTGIDPDGRGTIGGVPIDGMYWIRIDDSGSARIEEISDALAKASTEYRLQKQ